jgi:quercetin dioxygenase-like cupin family protein
MPGAHAHFSLAKKVYDEAVPFSAAGTSFEVHDSDDEAWHVLEGELTFRYADREETAGPGTTVFIPGGVAHEYRANAAARYLIYPRTSSEGSHYSPPE